MSTIGREKAANPLLRLEDEDEFVRALLGALGTFPPYFLRLGELNRRGPALPARAELAALPVSTALALRAAGAEIIDVRPVRDYARAHIPGALSIEQRPAFATWLGWLVPDDGTTLIVIRNPDQDPEEILWQARKIGYDSIAGEVEGGVAAWQAAGQAVTSTPLFLPDEVEAARLLDIRQRSEYVAGHVPSARNIELGMLSAVEAPAGPLVTMCGHGERAATAASVLERAGRDGVGVLLGGPSDWSESTGSALETDQ